MDIRIRPNECWWGGVVDLAHQMPYDAGSACCISVGSDGEDQSASLFLSSQGRYLWSEKPFVISFCRGNIHVDEQFSIELYDGYQNLKGAHQAAMMRHFPASGSIPDEKFFQIPQYNTWIEFMYNQNQQGILEYAHSIVASGLTPGILMIDEGWSEDYGVYDFYPGRFEAPEKMIRQLHELGFTVMLWVTPYISPDSNAFRELRNTDYLIRDYNGGFAIREWWNGFSCILDLSNSGACAWLEEKLEHICTRYGVDGFKFDGGDPYMYRAEDKTNLSLLPQDHTSAYDRFAARYPFNELRAVWNMGGQPLVCRLHDKMPSWDRIGLNCIIPGTAVQGLLGYYFGCPDMIGGGNYGAFTESEFVFDEELYIRWLEASLLCPMIQFSIAPWRMLSPENFAIVKKLLSLRQRYAPDILELARRASQQNEPIVRLLDYEFPGYGYEAETGMYLLGDHYLVVPMLEQGKSLRTVRLPDGLWRENNGEEYLGGQAYQLTFPLDKVYIFERMK